MVNCDDFGRMDARPQILLAKCFPLKLHLVSVDSIEQYLQALVQQDLIILYEVDDKPYLQMTTWDKHQQKRAKHSKYPPPPSENNHLISFDIKCNQQQSNVPEKRETRNENTRNENTRNENTRNENTRNDNGIEFDVSKLESGRCRDLITSFEKRIWATS